MTSRPRLVGGPAKAGGYRPLVAGPPEPHVHRAELTVPPRGPGQPLLSVAHLSDLHLCDAQSPARAELLDRWADPDSPLLGRVGEIGSYRAQEPLTAQVADAMARAVRDLPGAPVSGAPVDLAVVTGDNTDNAQANELGWYLALLDGGPVQPDSGDPGRWEGVADADLPDERFWHPDAPDGDLPRLRHGFPTVPGLLDAARSPFEAAGLQLPWLAVHGNHDRMLQGTVPALGPLARASTGSAKPVAVPEHWTLDAVADLIRGLDACKPDALAALADLRHRHVTPDPGRRIVGRAEFVAAHFGDTARPAGHGFTEENRRRGTAWYRHDHGRVAVLVLDTVNDHGGWQGSLDRAQAEWLDAELTALDADRRYAVLASHHPLATLVNDTGGDRVLAGELAQLLARHPSLVLWLNGHTHAATVTPHATWWEVTAPSLIDWPQQGRVVELLAAEGTLTVAATMLDHAGPAPWDGRTDDPLALAALSRELAANDWQRPAGLPEDQPRCGTPADRNVLLHLPDPWARATPGRGRG